MRSSFQAHTALHVASVSLLVRGGAMNLHAAFHCEIAQILMVHERCLLSSLAEKEKARVEQEALP